MARSARPCRDDDVAGQADRPCVSASPGGQQTLGLACKPFAAGRSPSVTSLLWVELCRAWPECPSHLSKTLVLTGTFRFGGTARCVWPGAPPTAESGGGSRTSATRSGGRLGGVLDQAGDDL